MKKLKVTQPRLMEVNKFIKPFLIIIFCSLCLISCKINYKVFYDETLKDKEFVNSIDGTQDYFNLFVIVDKSMAGNILFIEKGTSAYYKVVFDEVFKIDNHVDEFKLFKVENTKNIKIHVNNEYFHSIQIGTYKKYRFLYIKKERNSIEFKYSNVKPEKLKW